MQAFKNGIIGNLCPFPGNSLRVLVIASHKEFIADNDKDLLLRKPS
ncbi:hypothetical protein BC781_102950 [Sediminitomix flava]|uniref:Uncharacterized protein n=1 Tax=Sediminitomix flava TaxID=379075 RepID=A0A315ZE27_SEDFL|nr:hypothetical protein BC781_102950 [Sediminitomix flava]